MVRRFIVPAVLAGMLVALSAGTALGTIHPIVESFDCANEQAFDNHPLGDPADPLGQTPGATPGNGNNVLRALQQTWTNFPDAPTNPALFGHKLDGKCGQVGQP